MEASPPDSRYQTTESTLTAIDGWPSANSAAAVVTSDGVVEARGDVNRRFRLASVTKLLTALCVHLAVEEGSVDLDDEAGPPDSTVRHLLAHASGLGPDGSVVASPASRRIYSNAGYEVLAEHVAERTAMPFDEYLREGLLEPLGMGATVLDGSPAHGAVSTVADLALLAREFLHPQLFASQTIEAATRPAFADLVGVLPGFGRQAPNAWGLGPEIRGHKAPHWTGRLNSPETFGHFGQAGTFLWVDPVARVALVALTDEPFGAWAAEAWPQLADDVLGLRTGAERIILGDRPFNA